ncbi:unnamed protein product [marine sediment metagenome]|uniref:RNA polymerase sigma-70 region 4 domain-containing protein n=1 Tax=marine sediment metagenome TaxID=412755 RepID=X1BWA3_9ZZZZ
MLDYVGTGIKWEDMMITSNLSTDTDWSFLQETNLSPRQRDFVKLKYSGNGMKDSEVARKMGITPQRVYNLKKGIKDKSIK